MHTHACLIILCIVVRLALRELLIRYGVWSRLAGRVRAGGSAVPLLPTYEEHDDDAYA
jgi:hypothetical protein